MGGALVVPSLARSAAPRVVTIGGGVTETVFALGRGADVAGADAASLYPAAAEALPKLSYPKALTAEALLRLRPDILLVTDEAGPKSALDAAAEAGATLVRLPEVRRVDDIPAGVRLIAEAIGERARGAAMADAMSDDLARIGADLAGVGPRRRALALLGAPDANVLIAAGRGSTAGFALAFAGADNAAETISGWSWITPDDARKLDPDAVVTLSGDGPVSLERALAAPCMRDTSAARARRVAMVDALAFGGFGPRAAHAIHAVASRIYPEARLSPLPARRWAPLETAAL